MRSECVAFTNVRPEAAVQNRTNPWKIVRPGAQAGPLNDHAPRRDAADGSRCEDRQGLEGQAATAGSPAMGSSLKGAMVPASCSGRPEQPTGHRPCSAAIPIPGTTKLARLEENGVAVKAKLAENDLRCGVLKITLQGDRYLEHLEADRSLSTCVGIIGSPATSGRSLAALGMMSFCAFAGSRMLCGLLHGKGIAIGRRQSGPYLLQRRRLWKAGWSLVCEKLGSRIC